jgi:hypothetical protein
VSEHGLLPFVDAWSIEIEAPPRVVWQAVLDTRPAARDPLWTQAWAALWRADPRRSNGLPPHVLGAERPGFAVCEVVPPVTYALAGEHRFARYQLVFRVGQRGAHQSRLTAETFASFPGTAGRLYRTLLIDTRVHALVMWIMVRVLRHRAEALARREGSTDA